MRSSKITSIIIILTIVSINSTRIGSTKELIPGQENISAAVTSSIATGDTLITSATVAAQATTGKTSIGAGVATAASDGMKVQSAVVTVAQADENTKLAESVANQVTVAQKSYGQQSNAAVEKIDKATYTTEQEKLTMNDNTVNLNKKESVQLDQAKQLTNSQEVITDKSVDSSQIQSQNGQVNNYNSGYQRNVVITIDSGDEKVIIEKMISRDERVIIVNAAKYLKGSLAPSEIDFITQLKAEECNCKKVKDYIIEMLAESD